MRVLIADDSPQVARRVKEMVAEISGVEVVGLAENVAETNHAVRRLRPDVLILDLRMPGGSGLNVLEGIQKDGVRSTVIVLTNYSLPQYRLKCLRSGAAYFFDKSAEFEKVGEVLQRMVDHSRMECKAG